MQRVQENKDDTDNYYSFQQQKQLIKVQNNSNLQYNTIHYNNGRYQGIVDQNILPSNTGIIIDDQFNFFISQWNKGKLNQKTFINFTHSDIQIFGNWYNNKMKGVNTIKYNSLNIFLNNNSSLDGSNSNLNWINPFIIQNLNTNIIYIVQSHPVLNSPLPQIRIINRISNNSQNIKSIANMFKINISQHLTNPVAFLEQFVQLQPNIEMLQCINSQNSLFLGFKYCKNNQHSVQPLGIQFTSLLTNRSSKYNFKTLSIGSYNKKAQLSGIGLSINKDSQNYMGIFKDGMLIKQISVIQNIQTQRSTHRGNTPTFSLNSFSQKDIKNSLKNQHLKAINYVNNYMYFPNLCNLKAFIIKIGNYINMFQSQFSKHNPKAYDTFMKSQSQQYQFENKKINQNVSNKYATFSEQSSNSFQNHKQGRKNIKKDKSYEKWARKQNQQRLLQNPQQSDQKPFSAKVCHTSSLSNEQYRSSLDTLLAGFESLQSKSNKAQKINQNQQYENYYVKHDIGTSKSTKDMVIIQKNQSQQSLEIGCDKKSINHIISFKDSNFYRSNQYHSPSKKPGFIYSRSKSKSILSLIDTATQVPQLKQPKLKVDNNKQSKRKTNFKVQRSNHKSKSNQSKRSTPIKNNIIKREKIRMNNNNSNNNEKKRSSPLKLNNRSDFDNLPTSRVQKRKKALLNQNSPSKKKKKDYVTWQS